VRAGRVKLPLNIAGQNKLRAETNAPKRGKYLNYPLNRTAVCASASWFVRECEVQICNKCRKTMQPNRIVGLHT
jgi:hypothetical protein